MLPRKATTRALHAAAYTTAASAGDDIAPSAVIEVFLHSHVLPLQTNGYLQNIQLFYIAMLFQRGVNDSVRD